MRMPTIPQGTRQGWGLALRDTCQCLLYQSWNVENGIGDRHVGGLQRGNFALRRASIAGDNGPRVPHALSGRGGASRDESHYWFTHRLDILGGIFLVATSYFAAHHNGFRPWIRLEELEIIRKS